MNTLLLLAALALAPPVPAEEARRVQQAQLAAARAPIARLAASLVREARRPPALALVAPGSLTDRLRLQAALAALRPAIEQRNAGLRRDLARSTALAARDRATARIGGATSTEEARALADDAASLDALIASLDQDRVANARLARLDGPVRRPGVAPPHGDPPAYLLPIAGRVLAGTGEMSPAGVRARGLTLATAAGASVIAPAGAHVAYAGPFRAWRAIVILDHGHGWTTLVAGLSTADVTPGATVEQGATIGRASDRVTIELRHHGQPIDVTGIAVGA